MSIRTSFIYKYVIGTRFMHRRSEVVFNGTNTNLFVSIQKQNYIGDIDTSLKKDGKFFKMSNKPGDSMYVSNITTLTLNYRNQGGANIFFWNLPHGICSDANIISEYEEDVTIEFDANKTTNKCYFLIFADVPTYNITLETDGNEDSSLYLADTMTFTEEEPLFTHIQANSGFVQGSTTSIALLVFNKNSNDGTTKVFANFKAQSKGKSPANPRAFKELTVTGPLEHDIGDFNITYHRNYFAPIFGFVVVIVVAVAAILIILFIVRPRFNRYLRNQYLAKLTPEEKEQFLELEKKYEARERRRKLRAQQAKLNKGKKAEPKKDKTETAKEAKTEEKDKPKDKAAENNEKVKTD